MPQSQANTRNPKVSRVFTDRIAADGEQVSQVLEPDRTSDNVRYPDPHAPDSVDNGLSDSAGSNAEFQMARRTDAGPEEAMNHISRKTSSTSIWLWIIGGGALLLVAALVASM